MWKEDTGDGCYGIKEGRLHRRRLRKRERKTVRGKKEDVTLREGKEAGADKVEGGGI